MDTYPVIPDMKKLNIRFTSSSVPGSLYSEKPTVFAGERKALSSWHAQVLSKVVVICRLVVSKECASWSKALSMYVKALSVLPSRSFTPAQTLQT